MTFCRSKCAKLVEVARLLWRAKKSPAASAGLCDFERCLRLELVAQSGTGDIDRPGVNIVEGEREVEVAGPAKVVVQPFAPQEPAITTGPNPRMI